MEIVQLLRLLKDDPEEIEFNNVIAPIAATHDFTPVKFKDGDLMNEPGQSSGARKIFAFVKRTRDIGRINALLADYQPVFPS